jgi:hypothetical protein
MSHASSLIPGTASAANAPAISHVFSLGQQCYSASLLKRQDLKLFSGPFDWIFSSLPMACHCLNDDFATFLDRQYMQKVLPEQRLAGNHGRCEHVFYRDEFGIKGTVFNHHDPSEDDDYAYFCRAVERFRNALKSPADGGRVLLLHTSWLTHHAAADFGAAVSALKAYSGGRALLVSFAVIAQKQGLERENVTFSLRPDGHRLQIVRATSAWRPTEFNDPADEAAIVDVLRGYALPAGQER